MKKVKKNLQAQKQANQDWYDRRYNEDATQRADAQRILTMTEESIKNRNRQAAGAQAVMGGTEESVAATKAANNQALADATSQIAVNAEARKDQIEQQDAGNILRCARRGAGRSRYCRRILTTQYGSRTKTDRCSRSQSGYRSRD